MRRSVLGSAWPLLLFAVLSLSPVGQVKAAGAATADIDPASGLRKAANWELVRAHCGACHSYKLVTSNRGDRDYWLTTLRWMQRTQNLWPIPAEQEGSLLDYLASNYNYLASDSGETEWGRRPPLSVSLMPLSVSDTPQP